MGAVAGTALVTIGGVDGVVWRRSSDDFRAEMRKLMEDHCTWTRQFIVSLAANLPDLDATRQRLLQNPTDIGDAIRPFYSDAVGDQFTALLREHILIAADLVTAIKVVDSSQMDDAQTRWYANADAIAAFLNKVNPNNWPLNEMQSMMRMHLNHTGALAFARLLGDWTADISAYEVLHKQVLTMADRLTAGIVAQFPQRFL